MLFVKLGRSRPIDQNFGESGESITCCGDLFTCRERVAGNRDTEKSFSGNSLGPAKARNPGPVEADECWLLWRPTVSSAGESMSDWMQEGQETVDAPKPVHRLSRPDLRFHAFRARVAHATVLLEKIAFLLAGPDFCGYTCLRSENRRFSRVIRNGTSFIPAGLLLQPCVRPGRTHDDGKRW